MASDFAPVPPPARAPWGPAVGIGGALFATLALGFTEGCLEVERRPIPLRFALRFAAANVLPSAVWSSVPARHVAAASGVPLSALISDADPHSVAAGKRLVLARSVRALRLAVGSYGLAWSLWRWHSYRNNNMEEVVQYEERVVRLAPVDSPLSRASRRKHAGHIVTVPVTTEKQAVEWERVGVEVQSDEEVKRVEVIEVEIRNAEGAEKYTEQLKNMASRGDGASLCSVAVLPPCGPPLPMSVIEAFDVCFNPLSAVLTFIASVCHDRDATHVILVDASMDDGADAASVGSCLSTQQLVTGLLWRHGITATVFKAQHRELVDEGEAASDHLTESRSGLVFFVSESLRSGHSAARALIEQGVVAPPNACFIVEESLSGQRVLCEGLQAQSAMLLMGPSSEEEEGVLEDPGQDRSEDKEEQESVATYLSIADVSDQTLQGIRKMVRQGKRSEVIQAAVYQAYGTQRVVAPTRFDQFSDLQV
ncbi:hypothetical protein KRP22_007888 [Phytophthora ramorum]|nr:hypothetical protein KRP22_4100 [Phytophthora ramorum]